MATAGTLTTPKDYEEKATYYNGKADALNTVLELYRDEISDQMRSYLQGERQHCREQSIKCLKLALKLTKGE